MEIAFLFKTIENGEEKELMARLHCILPERYILAVPKGKNSPALLADFLDKCPGFTVTRIDKSHKQADLISFTTKEKYWNETVTEVCNAINDIYDTDISIPRQLPTPPPPLHSGLNNL